MASYELRTSRMTMSFTDTSKNNSASITNVKSTATADNLDAIAKAYLALTKNMGKETYRTVSETVKE